jgi:hypothetical protein
MSASVRWNVGHASAGSHALARSSCHPRPFGSRPGRRQVAPRALFDFASTFKVTGRRNRSEVRREKFALMDVVKSLCQLNPKQFKSIAHLLTEEQIKCVKLASSFDRTNPARGRQESLVAKLLRVEFDEDELKSFGEAVALATDSRAAASPEAALQQDLLDRWVQGIQEGEAAVMDELFNLPAACGVDGTQLRQLARQLEQQRQQQAEAAAAAATRSAAAMGRMEFVQDPELIELLAQRQKKQSAQQQQGANKNQTPAKQLRKFLVGPAMQVVRMQQQAQQQEQGDE